MKKISMREDHIHYAVRKYLKAKGWTLVAGEYPNGSDDELHSLRIMDMLLAKDESPDHRRHSLNKLVPDLIAYKDNEILIIEMKPSFSSSDERKLEDILSHRLEEFRHYLQLFVSRYLPGVIDFDRCEFRPALGFSANCNYVSKQPFTYFLIENLETVEMVRS